MRITLACVSTAVMLPLLYLDLSLQSALLALDRVEKTKSAVLRALNDRLDIVPHTQPIDTEVRDALD